MLRLNFALPAVVLATLYVACADPPKRNHHKGNAGASGAEVVGDAGTGAADDGGAGTATSGSGGTGSGGTAAGGEGGMVPSSDQGGEAGLPEQAVGGEGGSGAQAGGAGAPPIDPCTTITLGASKLPVPPMPTTAVAQPSGALGGFTVINWAGFKGAISYTFDDNLKTQLDHYEELNAVGIPMTFYIVGQTASAGSATWNKAVQDGHELGNHTMHHCPTTGTTDQDGCSWAPQTFAGIDNELDLCTAKLKSAFGVDAHTFAAPFGDSGWSAPAKERFILNRGVSDDQVGIVPNGTANPFNLPCHTSTEGESAASFNTITDGVRTNGSWRIILVHSFDKTIDGGFNPVKIADMLETMTYTKGLGDVWADTMVSIGGYWRAQKTLTAVQPATTKASQTYSWKLPLNFPPGQYVRATVTGGKVMQCGTELTWDEHGYYEINLDAGSVTISP